MAPVSSTGIIVADGKWNRGMTEIEKAIRGEMRKALTSLGAKKAVLSHLDAAVSGGPVRRRALLG
jgi:ABC-type dipeptide/oligopeptide/nickel transport system ATPase subunit